MTAKNPDTTDEPDTTDTTDTAVETVEPVQKPKGYNQTTGEFVL